MDPQLSDLLSARRGHFRLESGHHGELWLDLETLCLRPALIRRWAAQLAARLVRRQIEAVCGPLVEGAFVALLVAGELGVDFFYSEPLEPRESQGLYPVQYRVPGLLRGRVAGRRVAIVNDVIGAGSAVRGTLHDLLACGAEPVAIGALLALGPYAAELAAAARLGLECLAERPNVIWTPQECPLCAAGIALEGAGSKGGKL